MTDDDRAPPDAFTPDQWSLSAGGRIAIHALPDSRGADLTGLEYRVNGAAAVPLSAAAPGNYEIPDLAEDRVYAVQARVLNAEGPGGWSDVKSLRPRASWRSPRPLEKSTVRLEAEIFGDTEAEREMTRLEPEFEAAIFDDLESLYEDEPMSPDDGETKGLQYSTPNTPVTTSSSGPDLTTPEHVRRVIQTLSRVSLIGTDHLGNTTMVIANTDANITVSTLRALSAALETERLKMKEGTESGRCKVPAGQTPLDDKLGHRLLDVHAEGARARLTGRASPYHGHSLEHSLHAAGWTQMGLRLALDRAEVKLKEVVKVIQSIDNMPPHHAGQTPNEFHMRKMARAFLANMEKQDDAYGATDLRVSDNSPDSVAGGCVIAPVAYRIRWRAGTHADEWFFEPADSPSMSHYLASGYTECEPLYLRPPEKDVEAERDRADLNLRRLKITEDCLGELLATIHRDGGQHQAENGDEASTKSAIETLTDRCVTADVLETDLKTAVHIIRSLLATIDAPVYTLREMQTILSRAREFAAKMVQTGKYDGE